MGYPTHDNRVPLYMLKTADVFLSRDKRAVHVGYLGGKIIGLTFDCDGPVSLLFDRSELVTPLPHCKVSIQETH